MKTHQSILCLALAFACAITLPACKSKKLLVKKPVVADTPAQSAPKPVVPPVQTAPVQPPPPPPAPDYNFSNIQFDFNSAVLRTDAIQNLDHIASEMKKDVNARFMLNGHASSEGTAKHNMQLSIDRANSVKSYLVNAGIDGSRVTVKGFGATRPMVSNKKKAGRMKNRRVEVKIIK